jgi:hypothetical protein
MQLDACLVRIAHTFDRLAAWLFELPLWRLSLLVVAANVVTQGVWMVPNLATVQLMAGDLTRNPLPDPEAHFLLSSYLMPVLARLSGLYGSPAAYFAFCALTLAIGGAIALFAIRRRFGESSARLAILVLGATPLLNVLLTWIGYPDPLTVILATLLLCWPTVIARAAVGALLAVSHFEQGLVIAGLTCLLAPHVDADRGFSWRTLAGLAAGFVAGKLALTLHFHIHDIEIQTTRVSMTAKMLPRILDDTLRWPLTLLFSILNVAWAAWGVIMAASARERPGFFRASSLGMIGCLCVSALVLDQTRVGAILTWPLVLAALVIATRSAGSIMPLRRLAVGCFLLALVIPRTIVWEGHIHTSTSAFSLMLLSDRLGLSHFLDTSVSYWPIAPFRHIGPK